ncbi:MAG: YgiQ family radical SAM protein [Deferribacterales bacterium]
MFLPINNFEMKKLGWDELDIIFVSGDTYIDSPYNGLALLGKYLIKHGFRVGIIPQPGLDSDKDILSLGIPRLFWGVSSGTVDSMVANYTPLLKKRKEDDFTPGGINNRRPDRAVIKYTNLIRKYDKSKTTIVLGGIEASLRRIAHYDYWDDKIRRSILFDSKADILIYGMAELSILELADKIDKKENLKDIRGICYINKLKKESYIELPSYEEVINDKVKFIQMFELFYKNIDHRIANGLVQKHGDRYLIQNPPQRPLTQSELDTLYELEFEHDVHPEIKKMGKVKAIDTIKFSITINRGCYGECNFCAITVHQGATVVSRSINSIIKEVNNIKKLRHFDGIIRDLGGPTANMYEIECTKKLTSGKCIHKRCLFPQKCSSIKINHEKLITLMSEIRKINGVKKIFVASGIRYDMVMEDSENGEKYLSDIIKYHTSGQLKIAPEHIDEEILKIMGKPSNRYLKNFIERFYKICKNEKVNYFLTYYFIAAHPGCDLSKMKKLQEYIKHYIKIKPEQVQIYTPLPSTLSSVYYYTEQYQGKKIFVEKSLKNKMLQKDIITKNNLSSSRQKNTDKD